MRNNQWGISWGPQTLQLSRLASLDNIGDDRRVDRGELQGIQQTLMTLIANSFRLWHGIAAGKC